VHTIFATPRHPYTLGLLGSLPQVASTQSRLRPIPGNPPDLSNVPSGCPFRPRCLLSRGRDICRTERPALAQVDGGSHRSACHFAGDVVEEAGAIMAAAEAAT
jgi:oligopeptide/dipeptide ABC transporter ATP-binding protein